MVGFCFFAPKYAMFLGDTYLYFPALPEQPKEISKKIKIFSWKIPFLSYNSISNKETGVRNLKKKIKGGKIL